MTKVMVFGTFDGLHEGHRDFLKQARELGEYLIAVLPQDHIVWELKGKLPAKSVEQRIEHLRNEELVDQIVIGDHASNSWDVVRDHKPDVIALGHDQDLLEDELRKHLPKIGYTPKIEKLAEFEENIKQG